MRANNVVIKKYENFIVKQEINFQIDFQHESSNFYSLPKIHKSKIKKKTCKRKKIYTSLGLNFALKLLD